MLTQEMINKLEFYEKYYFSLDDPVPFKGGLKIYPVKVKDYYKFYSLLPCLTMNKNVKKVIQTDELGREEEIEVSNPEGMRMSYMAYLCEMMVDKTYGPTITAQVVALMEMILHEKNRLYCPHCHCEASQVYFTEIAETMEKLEGNDEKLAYWRKIMVCPECGEKVCEYYKIKDNGRIKKFCIGDYECSPKDFDELVAVTCHYNILGYDDDMYVDPDLKKDLDLKKKLQNNDYTSPTLEKQLVAVSISTGFSCEDLKEVTMRKLSFMLKLIDSKEMYYTQVSASMSGFVTFKGDIKHWVYSDNDGFGRDVSKELRTLDDLKDKLSAVT